MRPAALATLAALGLAGCFPELGDFDSTANGGAQQDDTDEGWVPSAGGGEAGGGVAVGGAAAGGGAPTLEACDSGLVCAPLLEGPGWSGPYLVMATAEASCPVAYPEAEGVMHELISPSNPCGCTCGAASGAACTAKVSLFDDTSCAGPSEAVLDIGPSCEPVVNVAAGVKVSLLATGGSCAPDAQLAQALTAPVTLCGAAWGACEGGQCLRPPSGDQQVCMRHAGLEPCQGPFPLRRVAYLEPPSAIACEDSDCACGAVAGAGCSGNVEVLDAGCGTAISAVVSGNGTCVAPTGLDAAASIEIEAAASGGGCSPGSTLDLTTPGPVATLCCSEAF